jgi:hypothetical protein
MLGERHVGNLLVGKLARTQSDHVGDTHFQCPFFGVIRVYREGLKKGLPIPYDHGKRPCMNTLLLDRDNWDITADAMGNIALASEPYSIVQDVASACRLFTDELWYGGARGIPYFEEVLGQYQPISLLRAKMIEQAKLVPGVLSAEVFLDDVVGRQLTGQIQVTTGEGVQVITL